ncbi:MAG: hypothetical protein A2X94_14620 [Bdellovibrionales bacterium GWB1_55_8]|nr:MAG: hypothetical protein A2X94_14620 [Bdellovibrionales bacterium GWB1_55_8]
MALTIVGMIATAGCTKKPRPDEGAIPTAGADENLTGDSDSGTAVGLKSITFPYDAFALTSEAKAALKENADILKGQSNLMIQVEGHADQRGGIQYNIALGEKRANAVRKYLMDLGISGDRITTISFGKERPLNPAATEEAYAQNRRANFVITSR